ncbi:hypothetical protein ACFOZ0_27720 [Streptomyces yaanensis]|uniref:Lipoprotein n=1 Tax=Streptomyces yaanensis TaxID=1142239 RepID=A0ABV7SP28_9ACTN|nr:hypothetical protein [Streptomyces sp. CGMCC 4.7035]WNB96992.1 hypothetical protein Q2K21_02295 [Streptomyces sp. CGMCC 4.7035]
MTSARTAARASRTARTARTRLLAAATVALAALALTACENGEGVRDEGPSSLSLSITSARGAGDSGRTAPCTGAHARTTATEVARCTSTTRRR